MTLHWWMHWFWVTALLTLHGSVLINAAPQSEELQHISTDPGIEPRPSDRDSRAMYHNKQITAKPENNATINTTDKDSINKQTNNRNTNVTTDNLHSQIQWTPANATDVNTTSAEEKTQSDTTSTTEHANITQVQNATFPKRKNLTRPEFVKEDSIDGVSESKIVTEKPLSLETPILQTRIPPIESYRRVEQEGGMDTGAIAGISFAALVLGALAGSTAFVLYRRRYLNKPQTLNDKCSNPDSSGYLDDSTVRDNSEEMYSLDNDSFLNSLEAMTIQNYWTDTVKHTKL